MSLVRNFIGNVNGTLQWRDDRRAGDEWWHANEDLLQPPSMLERQPLDDPLWSDWASPFWPAGGDILGGQSAVGGADGLLSQTDWWAEPWTTTGSNGRLGFVGYTRDRFGSPLGGCTVRCFRTSTDELVSTVTSDANGYYIATTPYSDGHYLVLHPSNPLDGAGATVNTLTPA